jgi:hypothetical protein
MYTSDRHRHRYKAYQRDSKWFASLSHLLPLNCLARFESGTHKLGEDNRLDACILLIGIDTGTKENHVTDLGGQRRDTGEGVHDVKRVLRFVARILGDELRRSVEQNFIIVQDHIHKFSCLVIGGSIFDLRFVIIKVVGTGMYTAPIEVRAIRVCWLARRKSSIISVNFMVGCAEYFSTKTLSSASHAVELVPL